MANFSRFRNSATASVALHLLLLALIIWAATQVPKHFHKKHQSISVNIANIFHKQYKTVNEQQAKRAQYIAKQEKVYSKPVEKNPTQLAKIEPIPLPKPNPIIKNQIDHPKHEREIIEQDYLNPPLPMLKPEPVKKTYYKPKAIIVGENDKKALKNNKQDNEKLAQAYGNIILNCIKSKFNLIALGAVDYDFNILAHFSLNPNGSLRSPPQIDLLGQDLTQRQSEIAKKQTLFAIKACTPVSLPVKNYEIWRDVNIKFYPAQ